MTLSESTPLAIKRGRPVLVRILLVLLLITLVHCGERAPSSEEIARMEPRELVIAYLESLIRGDSETADKCISEDYRQILEQTVDHEEKKFRRLSDVRAELIPERVGLNQPKENYPQVRVVDASFKVPWFNWHFNLKSWGKRQATYMKVRKENPTSSWKIVDEGEQPF